MEMLTTLLSKLDVTAVVAAVISFVIGLSIVKSKLAKAMAVIGILADFLTDIRNSIADGKLNKEEVEEIIKDGEALIAEFKK